MTADRHLRRQVDDPELRAKLTPDHAIGCKGILISNDYLPALTPPNVEVVPSGGARAGADWVQAADGTRRQVDTVILGTGFHVTDMPMATWVRGRKGRTLAEVWSGGAQAHRGTTVAGFPNLFILIGPNTGLGHTSMIYIIESQVAYTLDALRYSAVTGPLWWRSGPKRRRRTTATSNGGCGALCGPRADAPAGTSTPTQHPAVADVHLAVPPRHAPVPAGRS